MSQAVSFETGDEDLFGGVEPDDSVRDFDQLEAFSLQIQGGVLENLGIKMYTNVGKVLVEFAANAFEAESPFVDIQFDIAAIHACTIRASRRMSFDKAGLLIPIHFLLAISKY